jgi:hypothetical protein
MTSNQKLELAWIGKENRPRKEPSIRVQYPDDPQRTDWPLRSYEVIPDICGGTRCPCMSIRFVCLPFPGNSPAAPAGPPLQFWFDLNKLSVISTPELEKDAELERVAEIIRAGLTESDQQGLREWYLTSKLDLIQSTPISQMDIADLPTADGGKMIGFVDVFPCGGLALNFTLNDEAWAVDEQYCVQPGCRCCETVLSFLKLMDASGKKTAVIRETPSLRYNYLSEVARPLERPVSGPSPDVLLAVLKREQPSLNTQLERRHLIMQALYARHYHAHSGSRRYSPSNSPASASIQKIGRNAPCPCGSGRKYKHCCLNKSSS